MCFELYLYVFYVELNLLKVLYIKEKAGKRFQVLSRVHLGRPFSSLLSTQWLSRKISNNTLSAALKTEL